MFRSAVGYPNVLGMIMAGGEGSRLHPLTNERAKPAVYFGGKYRIIDFVLNNFLNSGIFKIRCLPSSSPIADQTPNVGMEP